MDKVVKLLYKKLSPCQLCPRNCKVERLKGKKGFCQLTDELKIFCSNLHFGEEPPISGKNGSGTIFFSRCNLKCIYCQNFAFSQNDNGYIISTEKLAENMLELEKRGAHNINWVTPTPHLPRALEALKIARDNGLTLPLVYNCGGYESIEILKLLDGIVDIYLPDAKYSVNASASEFSCASDYVEVNKLALKEMYKQVGDLKIDNNGIAKSGMIIRHLVLPNNLAGSKKILKFIADEIGTNVTISLMNQYFPTYLAINHPKLGRKIYKKEYDEVIDYLMELGFHSAFIQK